MKVSGRRPHSLINLTGTTSVRPTSGHTSCITLGWCLRARLAGGGAVWQAFGMKLTAVFEPAKEGGCTCFVEEVPAAISQGETLEEAKANLLDALKVVLECQRELAKKDLSPNALREPLEFAEG